MKKLLTETNKVQSLELNRKLREYSASNTEDIFENFGSAREGLSQDTAVSRLDTDGANIITATKSPGLVRRIIQAVVNPFNLVLIGIAIVTFLTDVVFSARPDYVTSSIIMGLVLLSGGVAFVQGEKSDRAAEKLYSMITTKTEVFRDGKLQSLAMEDIVKGDIIRLTSGALIPADVRFLTVKDAFAAQSSLTGESEPVEKFAMSDSTAESKAVTDLNNIGFMGTNMVSGVATAIVVETGDKTFFGQSAAVLSGGRSQNSFARGVRSVSKLLIGFMLAMVPLIFVINGLSKGDWLYSLLFAVTIAVGLTPEMLPVIMSSTLAKGAVSMASRGVIVKSLSAIQTFGEMDILCTDKTGTLTEDEIALEKYLDISGREDMRVLRHAYLNSLMHTGTKNIIDMAVIHRAEINGFLGFADNYRCVDEIPFDFTRRRMSVVVEDGQGKRQLITKGAAEEVMSVCSFAEINGKVVEFDKSVHAQAMEVYDRHNLSGLRVLAVAQKNNVAGSGAFGVQDECEMVLIGFVGFLDPPKESAAAAIKALNEHGVRVVVLTGDSAGVAQKVCKKVGIPLSTVLSGGELDNLSDEELTLALADCNLLVKLSPLQKQRVVQTLQSMGHTVGYMGDGINDAPPLRQADVGISVDSGVDIAKASADIILTRKDLMVLEEGVLSGRKTFGNIMKYLKMASSGNFGNMLSVTAASLFLPFLPMLPIHILVQNLLCDFAQVGIPFDSVDNEYLLKPRRWATGEIKRFMFFLGPLSSVFDLLCFGVLWFVLGANGIANAALFHAGWFVFGTASQVAVIYMIRTSKQPLASRPPLPLLLSTLAVTVITLVIGFTPLARALDMSILPLIFIPWLAALIAGYSVLTHVFKIWYIKRYGEWL